MPHLLWATPFLAAACLAPVAFLACGNLGSTLPAYEDLGPEAITRLEVVDFPVIVVNDCQGNDLYQQGTAQYAR